MCSKAPVIQEHREMSLYYKNVALAAVSSCLRRSYFFKTGTNFHMETRYFHMEALAAVSRCLRRLDFFKTGTVFYTNPGGVVPVSYTHLTLPTILRV